MKQGRERETGDFSDGGDFRWNVFKGPGQAGRFPFPPKQGK
ncbi:hypothetical protein B4135_3137 [Caldibacillus debilis]|uniref:Uncharacterized protein n=1 Tax=Caldibacillus debilis TaxID=301148 RepID=A0A150LIN3_9BACI|nr:hypothetical protein B4135_3137 [Caldibacillus debilis]